MLACHISGAGPVQLSNRSIPTQKEYYIQKSSGFGLHMNALKQLHMYVLFGSRECTNTHAYVCPALLEKRSIQDEDMCMYICMHVCRYVCMRVSVRTYVCIIMLMRMYVCMCTYVCIYVCMYACIYLCMYVCMYVCVCVYIL